MKVNGLSLERKNVRQTIDIQDLTGFDISSRPDIAIFIGQAVVDRILERTQKDNLDNNLKPLAAYSKSYKASDEFIAFGKNSSVDMSLSEGMLNSIDFDINGNTLDIFFDDPLEADKAYGHMTGMKGHKYLAGKTPKREFFGISDSEFMDKIFPLVESDLVDPNSSSAEALTFGAFLGAESETDFNDIFNGLLGDGNEGF